MKLYQVQYSKKTENTKAWERIAAIGGANAIGEVWMFTIHEAVVAAETGLAGFYVVKNNKRLMLMPVGNTYKYLVTTLDGVQPHSLMELPNFGELLFSAAPMPVDDTEKIKIKK